MKKLVGILVLIFVCVGAAFGDDKSAEIANTLDRLEQDYGKAIMEIDIDRIDQIMADDWRGVGESGRAADKASVLELVRSRKSKLEWFEIGPRDVKVLGDNVAIVQASVSERRTAAGVTSSLTVVYLDVWVKRGDRWLLLRSQTSKRK
ncbi:MAG: nuclear transport factor 2 family protein [Acidobacteria bacterium]|nr:nuclear transport factor 2 family protein [Acidobacteriota bacterium]